MFSGTHWRQVDAKGRLVLPAAFRAQLGDLCVVTRGAGGCLWIYKHESWLKAVGQAGRKKASLLREAPPAIRRLLAWAQEVQIDRVGRILISPELREAAEIADEAAVVGMGDTIEIWSRDRWEEISSRLDSD